MKYFRVKIGYQRDDFISIDETELPMAMRAQVSGRVAVFKQGTVGGNHIVSITPDFNRRLGFAPDYVLRSEDYRQLGEKEQAAFYKVIDDAAKLAHAQLGQTSTKPMLAPGEK